MGLSRRENVFFAFEEAAVPWLVLWLVALVGMGMRSWSQGAVAVISSLFGWLVASVIGFVVLGEPRILIQAQVAVLPAAVLVAWRWWRQRSPSTGWRNVASVLLVFAAAAIAGSVALTGLHRYDLAADWYRVVGQRELNALAELSDHAELGDLAIASRGPNGNPIGWWVQGYAGIPTYTNIDPAFLSFPDEREQAYAAAGLFAAPAGQAMQIVSNLGARFVILDRRGPDASWPMGEDSGLVGFSDGTLLISSVSDGP
jgi:hypothetical protein